MAATAPAWRPSWASIMLGVSCYCRIHRVPWLIDMGWFLLLAWFVVVPYCIISRERGRGVLRVGLFLLAAAAAVGAEWAAAVVTAAAVGAE